MIIFVMEEGGLDSYDMLFFRNIINFLCIVFKVSVFVFVLIAIMTSPLWFTFLVANAIFFLGSIVFEI